jgi:GTP-binding protein LepA
LLLLSNVRYRIIKTNFEELFIDNPAQLPPRGNISEIQEPFIKAQIITPDEYLGSILKLCMDRRGILKNTTYLSAERVDVEFELPLSEVVFDFYDKLKSISRGYASLDYDFLSMGRSFSEIRDFFKWRPLLLFRQSFIIQNLRLGRKLCSKLKNLFTTNV